MHQRGQPDRGLRIVREREEGGPIRDQPAVRGHTVDRGVHGELADAEKHVAARRVDMEVAGLFKDGLGGLGKVGRTAKKLGNLLGKGVHNRAACAAGRHRLAINGVAGERRFPARFQLAGLRALKLLGQLRELGLILRKQVRPLALVVCAVLHDLQPVFAGFVGHVERLVGRPV